MYQVLIIDDEKPARQGIAALGHWQELGITRLWEAVEGETGLALLRNCHPEIVLVDMKMPNMDGICFLEIAAREFSQTKYIVISGYDDFQYTRRAIQARVVDYLLKPIIESELNIALARAVTELSAERNPVRPDDQFTERVKSTLNTTEKQNLLEIKEYIDRFFYQEITLSIFADRYFLSKEYLSRLFKEEFGFAIYEYLLKIRMEKAKALLSDPGVKILTVSTLVGYKDNNYFSRAFKTFFGISPTEYRENVLSKKLKL